MRSGVHHSPEGHGVRDLPVEPDILIRGEEPGKSGANDTDNIAQHRHENHAAVEGQNQACATGAPYGPFEAVQRRELRVCSLEVIVMN